MNARRKMSLVTNTAYVPPPTRWQRVCASIRADWRTVKVITRQVLAAPSPAAWWLMAVIVTAAGIAALLRP